MAYRDKLVQMIQEAGKELIDRVKHQLKQFAKIQLKD